MEMKNHKKWHETKIFIILSLILIPPIGIYLMWKNNLGRKADRIILTIVSISILYCVLTDITKNLNKNNVINIEDNVIEDTNTDTRPINQIEFEKKSWEYINTFKDAENNSNDIKMKEIEMNSINFFRQQLIAENWEGYFISLSTIGEYSGDNGNDDFHIIWVKSFSEFKYQIRLTRHNEVLNSYLSNLKKGDKIIFSGIALQDALTPDRMVHDSDPSYKIKCSKIGEFILEDINELKDPSSDLRIGQLYDGGIIIKINNGHGLMIAPDDLDQIKGYHNHKPKDGGGYLGTYTWHETKDVLKNFNYNGHNDWRLPTKEEWNLIESQHHNSDYNMGTFYGWLYWASDEQKDILGEMSEAYQKNVGGSKVTYKDGFVDKNNWGYVRFVRDF